MLRFKQRRSLVAEPMKRSLCPCPIRVLDVSVIAPQSLHRGLQRGFFARPDAYPAVVRFANADPNINSDFKPDVRSLSFWLISFGRRRWRGAFAPGFFDAERAPCQSMNRQHFLATLKLLTASNPAAGLCRLSFKDKLKVDENLALENCRPARRLSLTSNCATGATGPISSRGHV